MNVIMKWKSNTIMNMEVATMTSQQDQKDEKVIAEDEKQTKNSFWADVFNFLPEMVGVLMRLIRSLF